MFLDRARRVLENTYVAPSRSETEASKDFDVPCLCNTYAAVFSRSSHSKHFDVPCLCNTYAAAFSRSPAEAGKHFDVPCVEFCITLMQHFDVPCPDGNAAAAAPHVVQSRPNFNMLLGQQQQRAHRAKQVCHVSQGRTWKNGPGNNSGGEGRSRT